MLLNDPNYHVTFRLLFRFEYETKGKEAKRVNALFALCVQQRQQRSHFTEIQLNEKRKRLASLLVEKAPKTKGAHVASNNPICDVRETRCGFSPFVVNSPLCDD